MHHYGVSFTVRIWVKANSEEQAMEKAGEKMLNILRPGLDYVEAPVRVDKGDSVREVWAVFSRPNVGWQIHEGNIVWPRVNMAPADYRDAFRKARDAGLLEGIEQLRLEV